tara:strand:+ start:496 stop:1155 length:660 start_codon:yes stop_codon:yes gene_type:complete
MDINKVKFKITITSILVLILCITNTKLYSQIKAITEYGDNVILFENGSWQYTNESLNSNKIIKGNLKSYYKPYSSSFLLKSKKAKIGIWVDNKEWEIERETLNGDAEFEFKYKHGDLFAMAIIEEIEIPLESLGDIAYEYLLSTDPGAIIVEKEYRNVNGLKVLLMKMEASIKGVDFAYKGYYYSDQSGTIQLITVTSSNLMDKYTSTAEKFLNGISTY